VAKQFEHDVLHTFRKHQKTFTENIHNGSAFMSAARRHNAVKRMKVSGRDIVRNSLTAETGNIGHFTGKQRIQHTAEEPFEGHKYDWHWMYGKMALAETDVQINSGSERIMSLVGNEIRRNQLDFRDRINKVFLHRKAKYASDFNVSTALLGDGLPDIVQTNTAGTTFGQGALGGLTRSAAANAWFRNQGKAIGANIGFDLQILWRNCTRNGVKPGVVFAGFNAYGILADSEESKKRNVQNVIRSGRKAPKFSAGYDGLLWNGAEVVWDHDLEESATIGASSNKGVMYMVSTEHWNVVEGQPWNFTMMDWDKPTGGSEVMARETTILHSYTHWHDMPRTCGVAVQIATS
jgi:hypothetical protein